MRARRICRLSLLSLCLLTLSAVVVFTLTSTLASVKAASDLRWSQSSRSFSSINGDLGSALGSVVNGDVEDAAGNDLPIPLRPTDGEALAQGKQVTLSGKWQAQDPFYPNRSLEHPGYLEIFSVSTANKRYFNLSFGTRESMNPTIIPHPNQAKTETWVMVAQLQRSKVENSLWFAQLVCDAQFKDGSLQCLEEPMILPLASTRSKGCDESHGFFAYNVGPHDGRIFYGPDAPYVMYGSNSQYGCFGLWMQDLRMLADWGIPLFDLDNYRFPTELQRQGERREIEKNWFVFWDSNGKMHVHFETMPNRAFAELEQDGSVGREVGFKTRPHDLQCLQTYLPEMPSDLESIHQATNTLSVTLCKRVDPGCVVTDDNTYIMTIIQHKSFRDGHFNYEPYVYLFQRRIPFKIHGISRKPLWIHGRTMYNTTESTSTNTTSQSYAQMFYMTGLSWKDHSQTYHGYVDDVLFLTFGIEDRGSAAIDVRAGDILQDVGLCFGRF